MDGREYQEIQDLQIDIGYANRDVEKAIKQGNVYRYEQAMKETRLAVSALAFKVMGPEWLPEYPEENSERYQLFLKGKTEAQPPLEEYVNYMLYRSMPASQFYREGKALTEQNHWLKTQNTKINRGLEQHGLPDTKQINKNILKCIRQGDITGFERLAKKMRWTLKHRLLAHHRAQEKGSDITLSEEDTEDIERKKRRFTPGSAYYERLRDRTKQNHHRNNNPDDFLPGDYYGYA